MAKKRVQLKYSGYVQGVGFRWKALGIAESHGLTGYVENLPDKSVYIIAEGKEEDILAFMENIKTAMRLYIRGVTADWDEYKGEFDSFTIRH